MHSIHHTFHNTIYHLDIVQLESVALNDIFPSCVPALCDSRDVGAGDGAAGGAGDERGVAAHARQQRGGTGAVCVLQPRTDKALWPRAGGGQQREVASG